MRFLYRLLFALESAVIFAISASLAYRLLSPPKHSGWDALADFLGFFAIALLIGFGIGLWYSDRMETKMTRNISLIVLVVFALLAGYLYLKRSDPADNTLPLPPTTPAPKSMLWQDLTESPFFMARLPFDNGATYFYVDQGAKDILDSLSVSNGQLTYAPADFFPAYLKDDYQLCWMKGISMTRHRVQIEVNKQTGRSLWVDKEALAIHSPAEWILTMNSVDPILPQDYPLRVKPLDHASPSGLDTRDAILSPIEAKGDWIKVEVTKKGLPQGQAWMRWKKDGQLLVGVNPFS
jgi:hypothetical protein